MKKNLRAKTATELEKLIDNYFNSRKVPLRDKNGEIVLTKSGEVLYSERPYTVTGLAWALGFCSREELFSCTDEQQKALICRALLKIEESAEEKLFCKDSFSGTKLFLATNFERWKDKISSDEDEDLGAYARWAK